ncbi:MAG: class I SAM-dependent methyltransferase [Pirellulaceae bacterium]
MTDEAQMTLELRERSASHSGLHADQRLAIEPHLRSVQDHYRETIDDYRQWSPEGNLHFGYWRWGLNPLRRSVMLAEMNRQVFQSLGLHSLSEGTIADLGCGVGAVSRLGSELYPQLNFRAMNISTRQIAEARQMTHHDRVQYDCADYHRLGWPTASIDGAFFMESLCYSLSPEKVIAEVARVLRPGARLVVTDGYLQRPLEDTSKFFRWVFRRVSANWAVPAYHSIQAADDWAKASGLRLLEKRDLSWRLAPSAVQSVPMTLYCAIKLGLHGERSSWRWRQLAASALALTLGLQRHNFRYYLLTFQK